MTDERTWDPPVQLVWPPPVQRDERSLQARLLPRLVDGASSRPRVMVGMLHHGECQVAQAIESLRAQKEVDLDLCIITGAANLEAHRRVYQEFMARSSEFDFFLKLDADMVLSDETSVARATQQSAATAADDLVLPLHDWLVDESIYGAHLFRSEMRWAIPADERLFVDTDPSNLGRKVVVRDWAEPFALHNPHPSDEQAYVFGVHRGRKAAQRYVPIARYQCTQAHDQLSLLTRLLATASRLPDRRRWLALAGAHDTMFGLLAHYQGEYREAPGIGRLDSLKALPDEELGATVRAEWLASRRARRRLELRRSAYCLGARGVRILRRVREVFGM